MPHITPDLWAHLFYTAAVSVIAWFLRALWKLIKFGNEELKEQIAAVADGPARRRADEVRIETHDQFAKIEKKMEEHEANDVQRFENLSKLIAKTQSA